MQLIQRRVRPIRRIHVSLLALVCWVGAPALLGAPSCAAATQIVVDVQTDLPCATQVKSTDIVAAADEATLAAKKEVQASQQGCAAAPKIGSAVLIPDGSKDQEIVIRVVTGTSKLASLCVEGEDGCIVARRKARFVANETVHVSVASSITAASTVTKPKIQLLNSSRWRMDSNVEGVGMRSPASSVTSIHPAIASSALAIASSSVSPAEKQPGRSGTTTPKAVRSVPGSIAMG
jgi:hypothetical protein